MSLPVDHQTEHQQTTKYPMLGTHQKLLGIFTYSQDLKPMLHYSELYQLYRRFHTPQETIRRVITYLGIGECFIKLPSEMQLRILLDKADHYTHKEIAQRMGMSHRTVDSHIDIMRYRLIDGDAPRVLSLLKRNTLQLEN